MWASQLGKRGRQHQRSWGEEVEKDEERRQKSWMRAYGVEAEKECYQGGVGLFCKKLEGGEKHRHEVKTRGKA